MLWVGIKSYFACAWSAFSYIPPWGKMPPDKPSYWAKGLGFNDLSAPEYADSVAQYKADKSFHRLKDILVEWADAWPQRAAKLLALGGCLLGVLGLLIGVGVGLAI